MRRLTATAALLTVVAAAAGSRAAAVPPAMPSPRQTPPPPAAPKKLTVPALSERTLANGVRVIVAPRPGTGLVSVTVLVRGAGGAGDPADRSGLANMTAALLNKGTATRSAPEIAAAVETLGGSLSAGAGWDGATVSLSVMRANLDAALPLLADTVLRPAFPAAELERERAQDLDGLAVELQQPGSLARYAAARVLYGGSPYGHPLGGTPESLKRLMRAEIQRFYQHHYSPDRAVVVFGGDITPVDAFAKARLVLGGWKKPAALAPLPSTATLAAPAPKRRVVVIDKPDAGQAAVVVTRLGIPRSDPDYYVSQVANMVLGGGYSSRLNREIRVKRGLSYGAGSSIDARLSTGPFLARAQTKNESAAEVASLLLAELGNLAAGPLPAAELTPRRLTLIGDFDRGIETGAGLGAAAARLAQYGIPLSTLGQFPDRVRAVTAADVKSFAARRLAAKDASVVVVGSAAKFLPDLKKRFPGQAIEVVPASKVTFDRATLAKP